MDHRNLDDRRFTEERLAPPGPAVIWGALMTVAVVAAGVTAWTARDAASQRVIASNDAADLRRAVRELTAQRDAFALRVARLERGVDELTVGTRATDPETTGSIAKRPPAAPAAAPVASGAPFAVDLGPDATVDAVQRRWTALSGRYPQLARLTPRARRGPEGMGVDLVAGPFATAVDAARLCASLADQGFACDTTTYAGELMARR